MFGLNFSSKSKLFDEAPRAPTQLLPPWSFKSKDLEFSISSEPGLVLVECQRKGCLLRMASALLGLVDSYGVGRLWEGRKVRKVLRRCLIH